jgi:7-carboxy-7-deazaguanine synthase
MSTLIQPDQLQETKAGLQEIFSSIQGEGTYVGKRQIFVRFNVCHLKCVYCDTPQRPASQHCEIETDSGSGRKVLEENPLSAQAVLDWIRHFTQQARHHSISFTGGEPLLYTRFLKVLLPEVQPLLPVYLETSGTQPEKLAEILTWVDIIAMDIKVPSATGEAMQVENHQRFYQLGRQKEMFIKLVVADETTLDELEPVREIVTNRQMPIIIQPVTSLETGENTVSAKKLFQLEQYLGHHFEDVRVIPQTHKMLSLL